MIKYKQFLILEAETVDGVNVKEPPIMNGGGEQKSTSPKSKSPFSNISDLLGKISKHKNDKNSKNQNNAEQSNLNNGVGVDVKKDINFSIKNSAGYKYELFFSGQYPKDYNIPLYTIKSNDVELNKNNKYIFVNDAMFNEIKGIFEIFRNWKNQPVNNNPMQPQQQNNNNNQNKGTGSGAGPFKGVYKNSKKVDSKSGENPSVTNLKIVPNGNAINASYSNIFKYSEFINEQVVYTGLDGMLLSGLLGELPAGKYSKYKDSGEVVFKLRTLLGDAKKGTQGIIKDMKIGDFMKYEKILQPESKKTDLETKWYVEKKVVSKEGGEKIYSLEFGKKLVNGDVINLCNSKNPRIKKEITIASIQLLKNKKIK